MTSRLGSLEDERRKVGPSGVEAAGEARGTGAEDQDFARRVVVSFIALEVSRGFAGWRVYILAGGPDLLSVGAQNSIVVGQTRLN